MNEYMLWPWTRIIPFIIYITVMPRGNKKGEGFIILDAIQTAKKTYSPALRLYDLIYEKEH